MSEQKAIDYGWVEDAVSPQEAVRDRPELLRQVRGMFPDLSEEQHLRIIALVAGTCGACRAAGINSYCCRDD